MMLVGQFVEISKEEMKDGRRDEGRKNEWMEGWVDRISKEKQNGTYAQSQEI